MSHLCLRHQARRYAKGALASPLYSTSPASRSSMYLMFAQLHQATIRSSKASTYERQNAQPRRLDATLPCGSGGVDHMAILLMACELNIWHKIRDELSYHIHEHLASTQVQRNHSIYSLESRWLKTRREDP